MALTAQQFVESLSVHGLMSSGLDHPFFGKMSAKDWANIAYKHIDPHLKQFGG